MNKDSYFTGQPVYSQVLKLLDREQIHQISRKTKGSEAYVKRFDGYQHLVVMLFGILKHFDSLRELEIGLKVHTVMKYHVGVPMVVQLTSAAKHDHYLLKEVHLPKDSTLAMNSLAQVLKRHHRRSVNTDCLQIRALLLPRQSKNV